LLAAHQNPASSPIPPPLGVINCRRLFEPIFSDFFKARKAGARGHEEIGFSPRFFLLLLLLALTAESVRAKALVGYPFDLYPDCIRTADEWAGAFEAGVVKCVAPWLYFRAPDSPADIADLDAAATYIKGPHVSKAFVAPGPGTVGILQASSECKKEACDATGLLTKVRGRCVGKKKRVG